MTGILFITFIILVLIGMPIAFTLGLASTAALLKAGGYPLTVVVQRMFTAIDTFSLMAIPFFMLAGGLMESGGISRRIVNFANIFVGTVKGGLAIVGVISSMFFAGVSGSAVADTAAMGSILIPAMSEKKYDRSFASAVIAASGTIGPVIPPSIPMVVYGVIAGVSIGDLFLAGVVPGALIGLALMFISYIIATKRNYPSEEKLSYKQAMTYLKEAVWAILMPFVIMGGILSGIFTPTEAGVIAAVYALIIGVFVYKEIKLKDLPKVFKDAIISTTVVMFIIATASLFSWILTGERIPQQVAQFFMSLSNNPYVILMLVNIVLLIVGTFLDVTPALILLMPVFLPLMKNLGIDLVHFGVVVVVNLCIGLLTPPVGTCLFVSCNIGKVKLGEISKAVLPFISAMIVVLFLITYFPQLIMWVPNLTK
ncbi:MAG: C4-dicarboxylate transporter, DctM subunit [Clostridiales bacterium]|jgi:C4-dicarboxylate transporter DctM subunit|nr:C4-dicarboxylate transporter, DctM subunit [Clostridiales bacterium]